MHILIRWAILLNKLPVLVSCLSLFILMVLTFVDVILRSVFNAPIEAATELTRLLMAIIVFSALPVVSAKREHIEVDLLDPLFKNQTILRIRDATVMIICGLMLFQPAERVSVLADRAKSYGDLTEYLNIPQFYIAYFIAIMTFTTALILVAHGLIKLVCPSVLENTK